MQKIVIFIVIMVMGFSTYAQEEVTKVPYIGMEVVSLHDVDKTTLSRIASYADDNVAKLNDGFLVVSVDTDSPAKDAGVQKDDIITRFDGRLFKNKNVYTQWEQKLKSKEIKLMCYKCDDMYKKSSVIVVKVQYLTSYQIKEKEKDALKHALDDKLIDAFMMGDHKYSEDNVKIIDYTLQYLGSFSTETKEAVIHRFTNFKDMSLYYMKPSIPTMLEIISKLQCNQEDKEVILLGLVWCEDVKYDVVNKVFHFSQRLKNVCLGGAIDIERQQIISYIRFKYLSRNWLFVQDFRIVNDAGFDYTSTGKFTARTAKEVAQSRGNSLIYAEYSICEDYVMDANSEDAQKIIQEVMLKPF
jgi:hypothetical protein